MLEPDIDLYGTYARGSAIADYLELMALGGNHCTRAQLEDNLSDKYMPSWDRKHRHLIVDPDDLNDDGELEDDESELMSYVDEAFECLEERADILGARYPFELASAGEIRQRDGIDLTRDVYVATLCLALAHAYRISVGINLNDLFEDAVADALEEQSLTVARVGRLSRENGLKFPETLAAVGRVLDIPTLLSGAPHHRLANDAGADVIGHLTWRDRRLGRWTFVGQVTCGNSDSWRKKLGEAAPGLWKSHFREEIEPQCFLAVPHHVPRRVLNHLVTEQSKVLVDRLRLVLVREQLLDGELQVAAAVLAQDVENLAAA